MDVTRGDQCELDVYDEKGTHQVIGRVGDTLLSTLHRTGVVIASVCGGNMICGTCHVWLQPLARVASSVPSEEEIEILKLSPSYQEDRSRLACQLRVHHGLEFFRIRVVPDE